MIRLLEATGAGEHADHRVVILGEDGVELVVMAAGAGYGHAEESAGGDVDLFIPNVVEHLLLVNLCEGFGAEGEETGGDHAARVERHVRQWEAGGRRRPVRG